MANTVWVNLLTAIWKKLINLSHCRVKTLQLAYYPDFRCSSYVSTDVGIMKFKGKELVHLGWANGSFMEDLSHLFESTLEMQFCFFVFTGVSWMGSKHSVLRGDMTLAAPVNKRKQATLIKRTFHLWTDIKAGSSSFLVWSATASKNIIRPNGVAVVNLIGKSLLWVVLKSVLY